MPKLFLSLLLAAVFAGYVVFQRVLGGGAGEVAYTAPAVARYTTPKTQATDTPHQTPLTPALSLEKERGQSLPVRGEGAAQNPTPTSATPIVPKPVPATPTSAPVAAPKGQYRDGTYTGTSVDAYYGNIQVKIVVSGGKISDVQFLDYPQDRSNSVRINTYAMPLLKSEAIKVQSANVDAVSGASFSSAAFKKSLASALAQA